VVRRLSANDIPWRHKRAFLDCGIRLRILKRCFENPRTFVRIIEAHNGSMIGVNQKTKVYFTDTGLLNSIGSVDD